MQDDPRVLLDATAVPADRGGVGRYVDHLAAALVAAGTDLSIVCQSRDAQVFSDLAPGAQVVAAPEQTASRAARLAWEQTTLPRLVRRLAVDVLHSPHYTMPLACPVPVVVTLHDATFFSDRSLHQGVKGRFFRGWIRTSLRRAAACVVPSQATADEIVRCTGARPGTLLVAHHGVDTTVFHPPAAAQTAALRERLALGNRPWIAFLGTLEPRKNVPALIRGYVAACAGRDDPPDLILAGSPGWDDGVDLALAQAPDGLRILRTGHLPIELLPALLGGALVVSYPSLGEGFGLPVLEAMACGAAVLTTRRLALPEVGGDAVAYTDVTPAAIGAALSALLDDPDRRSALSAAAPVRAGSFTWRACAHEHQRAYRRAAAGAVR